MDNQDKKYKKKEKLIVYENNDIIVWEASCLSDCITIASDYNLCTTKIGGGNLYPRYRLRFHSTFFFVRFKNLTKELDKNNYYKNPLHFIIVDAQKNNLFEWGFTDNVRNFRKYITKEKLSEKFTEFKILFDKDIIKNKPLQEEEKLTLNLQLE